MDIVDKPRRQLFSRDRFSLHAGGVLAQGVRFALSGLVVSVVYITITTVLSAVAHLPFQAALVIGWCFAVSVHFTLQRKFVWSSQAQYALPFGRQARRYLVVAGAQLAVSAATTTLLPPVLGVSSEVIYLGTAVVLTLTNFVVFRFGVFHARRVAD
jgi:putative flippase GtrA